MWFKRNKHISISYVFFRWLEASSLSPTTFCKKKRCLQIHASVRLAAPMRKKHPFEDILETQVKREIGLKSTFRYRQKKTLRIGDLISKPLLSKNENYTNPTSSAIARNRYRLSPKLEVFGLVVLHQVLYVRVAWRSGIGKYSYKWWGCSIAMLVSRSSNLSNTVSTETYFAKIICHQSSQPNSKMMNHDNIKPLKSANFPYKKPLPPALQTPGNGGISYIYRPFSAHLGSPRLWQW